MLGDCHFSMRGLDQGSKTFGNLEPGSPNAIFEFQEFEMQFLEAKKIVGVFKMKWEMFSSKLLLGIKCISLKIL